MSVYIDQMLNPFKAPEIGVPDVFARKTAVFKITTQLQVKSSTANGQIAGWLYPQAFSDPGSTYVTYYTDGASQLNISNMPAFLNLTANTTAGSTLANYYTYVRLVSYGYKFTYIGAEQTAAGEFAICFTNNNTILTTGADVKSSIRDAQFYATGRAESVFEGIWLPQDIADLKFRSTADAVEADKSNTWGIILFAGSGLPVNTFLYQLEITAIVEGLVLSTVSDYIPQSISPAADPFPILSRMKQRVNECPWHVCRTKGAVWGGCVDKRAGRLEDTDAPMVSEEVIPPVGGRYMTKAQIASMYAGADARFITDNYTSAIHRNREDRFN